MRLLPQTLFDRMVDAVKREDRERTEKARLAKEKKEQTKKEAEASAD